MSKQKPTKPDVEPTPSIVVNPPIEEDGSIRELSSRVLEAIVQLPLDELLAWILIRRLEVARLTRLIEMTDLDDFSRTEAMINRGTYQRELNALESELERRSKDMYLRFHRGGDEQA